MGYIEKKKRGDKTYFYLTENKREGATWKKTRRYLGVHTPAGFEKPRKENPKQSLSSHEFATIERIRKSYSARHKIGPSLWKEERDRLVSFVFNTNAIEGSSLSLEDTDSALLGKKVKAKKKDVRAAKNMKRCVDFIFSHKGRLGEKELLALHRIEMGGILSDAGSYRKVDVWVGNYLCPRHEEVPILMKKFFEWFVHSEKRLRPFEIAALAHLRLVRIHPFRDGNGRIARLIMNAVLLRKGYPLLNIFDSEKLLYYLNLRKVDASKRHKSFIRYLYQVYGRQYLEYLTPKGKNSSSKK